MTDAPLELYGARTGNSLRAAISLLESGLPHVVTKVDLSSGEHRGEAFQALNPARKVPVLIDRRDPARNLVVTQSNAIMLHVADAVPGQLAPAEPGPARTRFHERLFYFVTDVIAPNHAAFALRFANATEASSLLSRLSTERMEEAERFVEDAPFMAGESFSLVDIAAFTIAKAVGDGIDWGRRPALHRWYDEVSSRPAVVRGLQVFDEDHSS